MGMPQLEGVVIRQIAVPSTEKVGMTDWVPAASVISDEKNKDSFLVLME